MYKWLTGKVLILCTMSAVMLFKLDQVLVFKKVSCLSLLHLKTFLIRINCVKYIAAERVLYALNTATTLTPDVAW